MLAKLAPALALLFAFAGCSSNDEAPIPSKQTPGATTTPPAKSLPGCTTIWEVGKDLPENYEGCGSDDSTLSTAVKCDDGSLLVIYEEVYWAHTGGEIKKTEVAPLQDTEEYSKAYQACKGD